MCFLIDGNQVKMMSIFLILNSYVTLTFVIVKLQTKYNESGNKKSGAKSAME
ncbi:hypothetical protein J2X17_001540 [Flavobacterium aquidurense]|nr:hypothetical protein [Flavobacterium aquidurense]